MFFRVFIFIAVVFVVSLIRAGGGQLGWLGWSIVGVINYYVFFGSPSKQKEDNEQHLENQGHAMDEVEEAIRKDSIKSDELIFLVNEIDGIDYSLEPEEAPDYPVNEEINKICNCLSGFVNSLSLFKDGKWQKGVGSLEETKDKTEKMFCIFIEKDLRYFADLNVESFRKAKAIAERTLAFIRKIEFNWWESEKLGAAVDLLQKTEKALIFVGKGFFTVSDEIEERLLTGKDPGPISFEEGLTQIKKSHDLMESGILTKEEFERVKETIFCKMKVPI